MALITENHHFPMVFPWFPHGFPMVFPWESPGEYREGHAAAGALAHGGRGQQDAGPRSGKAMGEAMGKRGLYNQWLI